MPSEVLTDVEARADAGFLKTCDIVRTNGDCRVTYAISNPLDSVVAAQRALDYLAAEYPVASRIPLSVDRVVEEGSVVCGGKPMMYISGRLARSEENTFELQSLMIISYADFLLKDNTNIMPLLHHY